MKFYDFTLIERFETHKKNRYKDFLTNSHAHTVFHKHIVKLDTQIRYQISNKAFEILAPVVFLDYWTYFNVLQDIQSSQR